MRPDEIFNNCENLPNPLTKLETYELFQKINNGDKSAKDKLAKHNIKLVLNQVNKKFANIPCDKQELVEVGCVGLVKAINTFDISKGIEFSTYALPCIDNEIKNFVIKEKKKINTRSLNELVVSDNNEKVESLEDTISDDFIIEDNYSEKEMKTILRSVVEQLPELERKAITLYFGFIDNKPLVLEKVAKEINYSLSYTAVLIDRGILKIIGILKSKGIIEGTVIREKSQKMKTRN